MTTVAWPLTLPRLSSSSIGSFHRCPEEFRRKYLKKERDPSNASTVIGNAIHAVADRQYRSVIDTGMGIAEWEATEAYVDAFDHYVQKGGGPREIDWTIRVGRNPYTYSVGKCRELGLPLALLYLQTARTIEPIGCEEWFELNLPGCPVPIVGKIDLIESRGKRDIKFGATARQKRETTWQIQGLLYSMVDETERGLTGLKTLPFGWHTGSWGGPRSGPVVWTPESLETPDALLMPQTSLTSVMAERLVLTTVNAMVAYWTTFGPDEPWPGALQHSWACDFCSYRPECYWWHGPLSQLTFL